MTTIKNNLKKSVVNLLSAASAVVEVSSDLLLDASGLAVVAVRQVKPVGKELMVSPLSAYEGYLVEQGVDDAAAHKQAFAVLDQELSVAIRKGSKKTGSLVASMLEGWDIEDEAK